LAKKTSGRDPARYRKNVGKIRTGVEMGFTKFDSRDSGSSLKYFYQDGRKWLPLADYSCIGCGAT
jgi:hypothetical protein